MKNRIVLMLSLFLAIGLTGCGKYDDISIYGVKEYKFRGIKDGVIYINLTLDVENPNRKPLVIKHIEFKAWLNNREFGKLTNSEKVKLIGKTRKDYEVPLEIALRTPADAFKLVGLGKEILSAISVEGYIKGGRFPVSKKIHIPRQTLNELANTMQKNLVVTDTLSVQRAMP